MELRNKKGDNLNGNNISPNLEIKVKPRAFQNNIQSALNNMPVSQPLNEVRLSERDIEVFSRSVNGTIFNMRFFDLKKNRFIDMFFKEKAIYWNLIS